MQLTLSQLDFSVSLNSCHDEIMHKMQVLTNMQIELLRKFEHQLGNSEMHFQMIHDVRVMIVNLEEVYKDVKEYFAQMGIQFVFDFFRKIQVLMVCGYNFMSQALLVNVDKIEDKKIKDLCKPSVADCKLCKCTCQNSKLKRRQIKQVQHFDYKISMLQNEEQKLTSQIQTIYQKMMMQKTMIEKTKPSLAIRELEDMKEHIENVMESTNSIFEETYMMKYVEFKNYLTQIKKPEDIVDYFVTNMSYNVKEKFLKAMQKAIYKAQNMEERVERSHLKDIQVQTDKVKEPTDRDSVYRGFSSLKPEKNTSLLTKERKYNQKMMAELQFLRKQLNSLTQENQKMKTDLISKQAERKKSTQNYQTLQQLYNKRTYELDTIKSENKWLISEKQNQAKKLRHQIKELKKQQVETVNYQTQTYIAPNCVSSSTETEIIYFQNEVENQIINVLKKANQKMINTLNDKEKKIRQLKVNTDLLTSLKECKVSCMGFLQDLREVTAYKMAEINKDSKTPNIDKLTFKQPVVPLNEFTLNKSIQFIIQKLSEQIKTLLLNPNPKGRSIERRRSIVRRDSIVSSSNGRRNSKVFDLNNQKLGEQFFKNVTQQRHTSSIISFKKEAHESLLQQYKKSCYGPELIEKDEQEEAKSSHSQSSNEQKQNKPTLPVRSSRRSHTFGQEKFENQKKQAVEDKRSSVRRSTVICQKVLSQTVGFSVKKSLYAPVLTQTLKQQCETAEVHVQTDILRPRIQQRQSSALQHQNFILYGEYSQQTDMTGQQLTKLVQIFQNKSDEFQNQKNNQSKNPQQPYQSYSTRKHPYVRRPNGKISMQKFRTQQSDRNYVSVNHSLPMNESDISRSVQEHMNRTASDRCFANSYTSFANEMHGTQSIDKLGNSTLESRLSALINPNPNGINSGLIVFKKSKKQYEKRSHQLVFDELKLDKSIMQKQTRNMSFNRQRNESSFIQAQRNNWKEMISRIEQENEMQRQNYSHQSRHDSHRNSQSRHSIGKTKNQVHLKSIFVEQVQQDEQNMCSRKLQRHDTLLDVSKKMPIQRDRRSSQKRYEPPESMFNRAVKQMLMTNLSKETLMKKLQEVCASLEKEKEQKKIKKVSKEMYATRSSAQNRNRGQRSSQMFRLAEILG